MSGIKIKPLVWDNFGLEMWADSIVGKYRISGHGGKWSWTFDDDDPYYHGEIAGSEDEAKAACKNHFDAQIRSVIDDTPDALIKRLEQEP